MSTQLNKDVSVFDKIDTCITKLEKNTALLAQKSADIDKITEVLDRNTKVAAQLIAIYGENKGDISYLVKRVEDFIVNSEKRLKMAENTSKFNAWKLIALLLFISLLFCIFFIGVYFYNQDFLKLGVILITFFVSFALVIWLLNR